MRMPALTVTQRDRRTLISGAAGIALLVLVGRGLPALRRYEHDQRAAAAEAQDRLARIRASMKQHATNARVLAEARRRLVSYDSALLVGRDPTAVQAQLSALITEAGDGAEAQLGGVQLQADSTATTMLSHASARTTVTGDLEAIGWFMESLEAGPPLVAIREVSITQAAQPSMPQQHETLRAELVVESLFANPRRGGKGR